MIKRIQTHRNDDGCFFTLPLGLPNTEHDCQNSQAMRYRRNVETLLPTNRYTDQQRITTSTRSNQLGFTKSRHTNETCFNKPCSNYRLSRETSCFFENFLQDFNVTTTIDVAQLCTDSSHELQHKLS